MPASGYQGFGLGGYIERGRWLTVREPCGAVSHETIKGAPKAENGEHKVLEIAG
jgi:hypothetical protein